MSILLFRDIVLIPRRRNGCEEDSAIAETRKSCFGIDFGAVSVVVIRRLRDSYPEISVLGTKKTNAILSAWYLPLFEATNFHDVQAPSFILTDPAKRRYLAASTLLGQIKVTEFQPSPWRHPLTSHSANIPESRRLLPLETAHRRQAPGINKLAKGPNRQTAGSC